METRAAVLVADRTFEMRMVPVPDELPPGWGLLRVEGNGVCGSDYGIWSGELSGRLVHPLVPGHELVGRVERLPEEVAAAWGVTVGDRIAVEPFARCGACRECLTGRGNFCRNRFVYGSPPLSRAPGITGGLAGHVALHPRSTVYKIAEHLSIEDAVLFNPLGNSFEWTLRNGGVGVGDRVLILGAGQRGLGCAIAAKEAGASQIIVTGLRVDEQKLNLAVELGATDVIVVDEVDTVARVLELTDGDGVDVTLELVPGATQPIVHAVAATRAEGTVVLAGMKGGRAVEGLVSDDICRKGLVLRGSFGLAPVSTMQAIATIESGRYPLEKLHSHTFPLDEVDRAVRILGGEVPGEQAIHITVVP